MRKRMICWAMAALLLLSDAYPAFAAESATDYSDPDSAAQAAPVTPDLAAPDDDSGDTNSDALDDSGDTETPAQTAPVAPDTSGGAADNPDTPQGTSAQNDSGDTKKPLPNYDFADAPPSDLAELCSSATADYDQDNGPDAQGQSPTKEDGTSTIAGEPADDTPNDTPPKTYYYYKVQLWVSDGADFKLNTICTPLLEEPEEKLPWPALWPRGLKKKLGKSEFEDVLEKDYFFDSVLWAVRNKITNGKTETSFSPAEHCTHWQILTFLWRICGEPRFQVSKENNIFKGLDYAEKRVHIAWWAMRYGLGAPMDGNFGDDQQPCTRAQAMRYIWILSGCPEPHEKAAFTDLPDNEQYVSAISWAVEQGITKGTSETTFSPNQICNRANIVTFLYRAWQSAKSK